MNKATIRDSTSHSVVKNVNKTMHITTKLQEEDEMQKLRDQDEIKREHLNRSQYFEQDEVDMKPMSLNEYYSRSQQANILNKKLQRYDGEGNNSEDVEQRQEQVDNDQKKFGNAPLGASTIKSPSTSTRRAFRKNPTNGISAMLQLQSLSAKFEPDSQAQEELQRLIMHEDNMDIMNPILEHSAIIEQKLVAKVGAHAFSSVAKHDRGVKRQEERSEIEKMLNRIHQRTVQTSTLEEKKINHHRRSSIRSNLKSQWIDNSKIQARNNLNELEHRKRVEDIIISAQIKQENTTAEYKHTIERINEEKLVTEANNRTLKNSITKLEEEISSLKYTISLLRQKLSKISSREVESQQKLKQFAEYEPLFEDMRKNFNFDNPQQVIKRMELLEKQSADYMQQLLNAEHEKNEMQRQLEKTKQEVEMENRERLLNLTKNLERSERQAKELQKTVEVLQKAVEKANTYSKKYFDLNNAVIDIWDTWLTDIEHIGCRNDIVDEPDRTDSNQLLSALKNLLITFTPTKAGKLYTELSILSNKYWIRYFKDFSELKSQPKKIFESIGAYVESKEKEIAELRKEVARKNKESKELQESFKRAMREKNSVEQALSALKSHSRSHILTDTDYGRNPLMLSKRLSRPNSAPMHRRKKSSMESSTISPARAQTATGNRQTNRQNSNALGDSLNSSRNVQVSPLSTPLRTDRYETLNRIKQELNITETTETPKDSVFISQNVYNT